MQELMMIKNKDICIRLWRFVQSFIIHYIHFHYGNSKAFSNIYLFFYG